MRLHSSLTACLFIICTYSSLSNPFKTTLTGEIIGRNSKALLLFKPTDKIQDEKSRIRIPIKNNRFSYTLNVDQVEMYQLVFEDELEKGSYKPILFFPFQGKVHFTLHPFNEFDKNLVDGGPLNEEYSKFSKEYIEAFEVRLASLSIRTQKLRENNDYDRPEYRELVKQWQSEKDFDKKQEYLNQMGEWQKTGRQHTENGNNVKAGFDSVSDDMAKMRFQYMREHTTLPAYFLMVSDMRYGNRNRLAANNIAELYPRFAAEFPDHVYTQRVGSELNGMLRIRPGEKLMDISIPDINGQVHSLLKSIEGKAAVIDFWGSWCGPCIAKTRKMQPLYNAYKDKGFTMIGIAREYKNTKEVKKRLSMEKWEWLQLLELDDQNKVWTRFGIADATGMMLLVDKNGVIVAVDPEAEVVERFLRNNE